VDEFLKIIFRTAKLFVIDGIGLLAVLHAYQDKKKQAIQFLNGL
jgi:hypothetical protein